MTRLTLPLLLVACAGPALDLTDATDTTQDLGSPPSAAEGVFIEPVEPTTLQDLTLVVGTEPTDPDGDYAGLVIRWTRDGEAVAELDGARTVPADRTARDETWEVVVRGIDDLANEGPSANSSVSIANLPPGAPTLTLVPEAPIGGEHDLLCTPEAIDPDGDALTYTVTWTHEDQTVEDRLLPGSRTSGDQLWTCTATATDGTAESAPATASVRTLVPPIPVFTLVDRNPTSPRYRRDVSPRDYLEKVSGWYFTHAT